MRLASEGGFAGTVLDVGCGTGENALHVAAILAGPASSGIPGAAGVTR